ncbi:hypothetical protein M404DRAFT_291699 [Pisolithus tinctorius Marx 270]|uniref:Uncharacterized protein n=1 Tax=Pisolithus tinctorius Marx 270 TaxID=870435 RepID=A0A0C3N4R3_PISTI|nr:hypothetical protein M404DRAFT_291699 [Pisolithus tinctorius Marx 270]
MNSQLTCESLNRASLQSSKRPAVPVKRRLSAMSTKYRSIMTMIIFCSTSSYVSFGELSWVARSPSHILKICKFAQRTLLSTQWIISYNPLVLKLPSAFPRVISYSLFQRNLKLQWVAC